MNQPKQAQPQPAQKLAANQDTRRHLRDQARKAAFLRGVEVTEIFRTSNWTVKVAA